MDPCHQHSEHTHIHGKGCGHTGLRHEAHVDYAHDGHLHHTHEHHCDDHALAVDKHHPDACTPGHACGAHPKEHVHSASCSHPRVPHGDHEDHWVQGHLHHAHDGHCDDHGKVPHG